MRWDWAFREAAVLPFPRPFALEAGAATGETTAVRFFGGRPLLLAGPWSASIARLSLSRSATRRATICSVCIRPNLNTRFKSSNLAKSNRCRIDAWQRNKIPSYWRDQKIEHRQASPALVRTMVSGNTNTICAGSIIAAGNKLRSIKASAYGQCVIRPRPRWFVEAFSR
jgi:hypothetical protein